MNYVDDFLIGKGLFVFSDPGGAKPILAFIFLKKITSKSIVITDREYDFFSDYPGVKIIKYTNQDINKLIKDYSPSYVFTGTSYTSKIELNFLISAKKLQINTFSLIDHYSNHLERFFLNNEIILPNYICYPSIEIAKISKNKIKRVKKLIFQNYHHSFLKQWTPKITKSDFISELGIDFKKKILLFAPDPISNIGGKEKFGIDEVGIWNLCLKNLELLDFNSFIVILKLHPNQNQRYFIDNASKSLKVKTFILNNYDTNTLIFFSDIVLGMFSNILVESLVMNKKVIRCLVNYNGIDPFSNDHIGKCLTNEVDLFKELKKEL